MMKLPLPTKEVLERSFGLWLDARRSPSLDSWSALADEYFIQAFGEDDDNGNLKDEDQGVNMQTVLHALVEVSWKAWKVDCEKVTTALEVGLFGDEAKGTPPFINPRMGVAHIELGVLQAQVGGLCLSDDARALGMLLLTFNLSEGFIRPGMAMTTFQLRMISGDSVRIEDELRRNDGGGLIRFYRETRDRFVKAISTAIEKNGQEDYLKVLDRLMNLRYENIKVGLSSLRNAVGHQDFDIINGTTKLNWAWHAGQGDPGKVDILTLDELEQGLEGLRSLAMTFIAWEQMLIGVLCQIEIPDDAKATIMAETYLNGLETMRKIAWPFFQ